MTQGQNDVFKSRKLSRIRRNRWILGLAASPLLLTLAALAAGIAYHPIFFVVAIYPTIPGFFFPLLAYRRNWRPVLERVRVRADRRGIQVGDQYIPRADIRDGVVVPAGKDQPIKVMVRRELRPAVDIAVRSQAQGRRLLHSMGLDVSQRVAEFRAISRIATNRKYLAATMGAFGASGVIFVASVMLGLRESSPAVVVVGAMVFVLGIVTTLALLAVATKLSVGADGIVVRWLGRPRFLGYGEILSVARFDEGRGRGRRGGVMLTLRSGEQVRIPIGAPSWQDETVAIVEERIREAMEGSRRGGAEAAALLRRGDREVSSWVAALRVIGSGANADLRTAPVPRERLFRIVEDPTAQPSDRAAAAIALGVELGAGDRARLRSAAEATAEPRLRIAIKKAAGGSEVDELSAALAEIEAEAEGKQRRRSA